MWDFMQFAQHAIFRVDMSQHNLNNFRTDRATGPRLDSKDAFFQAVSQCDVGAFRYYHDMLISRGEIQIRLFCCITIFTISISITHIDRTNWKFSTHISCSCWCKWLTYTPTDKADEKSTFVHKSMAAYGAWSIFTFIVIHLLASFPSSSEYSSKTKLPALEQCIGQCPQAAEHFIPCLMQLHLAL